MTTRKIICESCDFDGSLSYHNSDFAKSDISYCPACGGDITEDYNTVDNDWDIDPDLE